MFRGLLRSSKQPPTLTTESILFENIAVLSENDPDSQYPVISERRVKLRKCNHVLLIKDNCYHMSFSLVVLFLSKIGLKDLSGKYCGVSDQWSNQLFCLLIGNVMNGIWSLQLNSSFLFLLFIFQCMFCVLHKISDLFHFQSSVVSSS